MHLSHFHRPSPYLTLRRAARFSAALLLGLAVVAGAPSAHAGVAASEMREGARHAGPLGWRVLCKSDASMCAAPEVRRPHARAALGEGGRERLQAFNARINAALRPAEDLAAYGATDLWRLPSPGDYADCEDYALAKRDRLLAAGWPPETVLIAVVEGTLTPYHAVLVLRTDEGELVLDNLTDDVLEWRDSGYVWVVRQSAAAPERWVRVIDGDQMAAR